MKNNTQMEMYDYHLMEEMYNTLKIVHEALGAVPNYPVPSLGDGVNTSHKVLARIEQVNDQYLARF